MKMSAMAQCRVGARTVPCQRTAASRRSHNEDVTGLLRRARVAMLCWQCGAETRSASPSSPPAATPTGAYMKLSISYKHVDAHEAVEKQNERHLEKLSRLLKTYEPDLVQLHGAFSKNPHNHEHSFSLNLSLPTGTLHATGTGATVRPSRKKRFAELQVQVKKHQSRLRKDYEWKRKRPHARPI